MAGNDRLPSWRLNGRREGRPGRGSTPWAGVDDLAGTVVAGHRRPLQMGILAWDFRGPNRSTDQITTYPRWCSRSAQTLRTIKHQTPARAGVVMSGVPNCRPLARQGVMEAAGIAPASRDPSMSASTCVADHLVVGVEAPIGRVLARLAHHEFNPGRNERFGLSDPVLASSGEAHGTKLTPRSRFCF